MELAEAIIDRCRRLQITRQRLVDNAWRSSGSCVEGTEEPSTLAMDSVADDANRSKQRSRAASKAKPSKNVSNRRTDRRTDDHPTEPPQPQWQARITSCVEDEGRQQQRRKRHAENEQRKSSHRVKEDKKSLPENGREKPTRQKKRKEASKEAGGEPATAAPMPVVIEVVQETLSSGPLIEVMAEMMTEQVLMATADQARVGIRLVFVVVAAAAVAAIPDTIILRTTMLITRIEAHHPKQLSVGLCRMNLTAPQALKASCAPLITVLGTTSGPGQTNWPTFAGH